MEQILNKIRNLLDLASNNPNEHEAAAAALKAQELMAKHNVELADLNEQQDEIYKAICEDSGKHEMKTWKFGLANIIAENFCCKTYSLDYGRRKNIVFYGHKSDAQIAKEVFQFLYEMGGKLALRTYNKVKAEGGSTKGLMNTYLMGFKDGIAEVLGRQCTALMLVVPEDVESSFAKMAENFRTSNHTIRTQQNNKIREQGRRDGRAAVEARQLTTN